MCVFVFVYVLDDDSQHIVLASGVVFRADAQRFVAYDAERQVARSKAHQLVGMLQGVAQFRIFVVQTLWHM